VCRGRARYRGVVEPEARLALIGYPSGIWYGSIQRSESSGASGRANATKPVDSANSASSSSASRAAWRPDLGSGSRGSGYRTPQRPPRRPPDPQVPSGMWYGYIGIGVLEFGILGMG